jgi:uncharacterized protein (DUF2344 family)
LRFNKQCQLLYLYDTDVLAALHRLIRRNGVPELAVYENSTTPIVYRRAGDGNLSD